MSSQAARIGETVCGRGLEGPLGERWAGAGACIARLRRRHDRDLARILGLPVRSRSYAQGFCPGSLRVHVTCYPSSLLSRVVQRPPQRSVQLPDPVQWPVVQLRSTSCGASSVLFRPQRPLQRTASCAASNVLCSVQHLLHCFTSCPACSVASNVLFSVFCSVPRPLQRPERPPQRRWSEVWAL